MYSDEELKEIEEVLTLAAEIAASKMGDDFKLVYHYSVKNLES